MNRVDKLKRYEELKDSSLMLSQYVCKYMPEDEFKKLKATKTILSLVSSGLSVNTYEIISNPFNLSDSDLALIADHGHVNFGYNRRGTQLDVYVD